MSNRKDHFDEEQDYRKIQKSSNRRDRRNDRHKNRQNLHDIVEKINKGVDLDSLENELEDVGYE